MITSRKLLPHRPLSFLIYLERLVGVRSLACMAFKELRYRRPMRSWIQSNLKLTIFSISPLKSGPMIPTRIPTMSKMIYPSRNLHCLAVWQTHRMGSSRPEMRGDWSTTHVLIRGSSHFKHLYFMSEGSLTITPNHSHIAIIWRGASPIRIYLDGWVITFLTHNTNMILTRWVLAAVTIPPSHDKLTITRTINHSHHKPTFCKMTTRHSIEHEKSQRVTTWTITKSAAGRTCTFKITRTTFSILPRNWRNPSRTQTFSRYTRTRHLRFQCVKSPSMSWIRLGSTRHRLLPFFRQTLPLHRITPSHPWILFRARTLSERFSIPSSTRALTVPERSRALHS